MRVSIQKQIIELIPTVWEGIKYAKRSETAQSLKVLGDCIDALSAVGNTLNSQLSEERSRFYADIINCLKEMLFKMADMIENSRSVSELSHSIRKQLDFFKKSIQYESEVKLEIVFLPYNSSMWDSMESVWRAAKDDPRCSCHVVPIPYYVNTEKNDFSILKYEGEQFPSEVPITHYNDYDIAKSKPDVIYIHNPYDNWNSLTRVPSLYFSDNLVNYTNMLVYIPYFVSTCFSKNGENDHFYLTPGAKNSNKIIAQSDAVKNYLIKLGHSPKRILSFGSPKIDSVIYYMKHVAAIPDHWRNKIQGKVFLLNTKIFHFAENGPLKLKSIADFFNIFKDDPNCTLIWRPHPLAVSGIKKYTPHLYDQYMEIEENFKKVNNFIYDDQPSYLPAFYISDAFISDISSLIVNYLVTAKPVLLLEPYYEAPHMEFFIPSAAYYNVHSGTKVLDFKNMVIENRDPVYETRIKEIKKAFPNYDGSAGEKIHNYICNEMLNIR